MTDESQIIFLMAKIEFCGVAKVKTKKTKQKLMTFFQEEKTCENDDAEISKF